MFHSSEIRELPMLNENVSKFDIITYGKKEALTRHDVGFHDYKNMVKNWKRFA